MNGYGVDTDVAVTTPLVVILPLDAPPPQPVRATAVARITSFHMGIS
jgi:hypothetical protein